MIIYILDTRKQIIDPNKVKAAAEKMKIDVYFSEFSFCPYLYSYKDEKDIVYIGNLNDGAVDAKKSDDNFTVVDCDSLENFIRDVFALKFGKPEEPDTNRLF